jgi:hypothetical protein
MFVFGADFFLMLPGMLLLLVGFTSLCFLAFGPLTVRGVTLSVNSMLLFLALGILGLQLSLIGVIAQSLYDGLGVKRRRWLALFSYTRTAFVTAIVFVVGLVLVARFVTGFIEQNYHFTDTLTVRNHQAIFGLFLMMGSSIVFVSMLLVQAISLYVPVPTIAEEQSYEPRRVVLQNALEPNLELVIMNLGKRVDLRWTAKKYLPKRVTDLLRSFLPESIYYPGYGQTTLSGKKLDALLRLLDECLSKELDGDLIECGVFRGGSLVQIGRTALRMAPSKKVFGADTFEGHPSGSPEDIPPDNRIVHHKGLFSGTDYNRVSNMLRQNHLENTFLLKGMLGDTLPTLGERTFCFAHLDLDLYVSTKQALEFIEPRLVSGGMIIFDDYGGFETPGVEKAVSELLPHAQIRRTAIDPIEGSQAFWVKP